MTYHILTVPADLEVLAKDALHIAPAEKHIANTFFSGNYRFFALMNTDR
jgi:hypothetical protein